MSARPPSMTPREIAIIHELMTAGSDNKTIGKKLGIAESTVKIHLKGICRKLRVSNRTQVALWGVANLSAAARVSADEWGMPI
jgi:two-component system nitrate/nitrite response regulator NarL